MSYGEIGDRVELVSMPNDPDPITPGTQGTIVWVDDAGTRHVDWDDGRHCGLLPDADNWILLESNPVHEDHREPEEDEGTPYP